MIVRKVKEEEKAFIEDFVLEIFRDSTPYSDGVLEKALVKEIRENKYYIPEFDLVAEEDGKIVGHYMMSKFPISGKHKEEMLILTPVSVAISHQRRGIGTDMIKEGLELAKKEGYTGIIVEGNPQFYNKIGFETSTKFGIYASEKNLPPSEECLMAMELVKDGLENIKGEVCYSMYNCLT